MRQQSMWKQCRRSAFTLLAFFKQGASSIKTRCSSIQRGKRRPGTHDCFSTRYLPATSCRDHVGWGFLSLLPLYCICLREYRLMTLCRDLRHGPSVYLSSASSLLPRATGGLAINPQRKGPRGLRAVGPGHWIVLGWFFTPPLLEECTHIIPAHPRA